MWAASGNLCSLCSNPDISSNKRPKKDPQRLSYNSLILAGGISRRHEQKRALQEAFVGWALLLSHEVNIKKRVLFRIISGHS